MAKTELITSKEAVKLFIEAGISESSFRKKVRDKEVETKMPEGRQRGALYRKDQILAIIRNEKTGKREKEQQSDGQTDWIRESDLPYLLALDLEMYGIENTVDISITHAWWKKNPTACRILFNKNDRREIWGAISAIPMKEETIFKLLSNKMQEKQITPEDILSYENGGKYCVYIPSAVIKPEHRQSFGLLMGSILDFYCEQYPKIQLEKLYAFAATDEGYDLIRKLFFSPRYDLGKEAFELDPSRRNPSRTIKSFQQCIASKQEDSTAREHQSVQT